AYCRTGAEPGSAPRLATPRSTTSTTQHRPYKRAPECVNRESQSRST
ncbi:rCG28008, partial [Rattus norvegicus]